MSAEAAAQKWVERIQGVAAQRRPWLLKVDQLTALMGPCDGLEGSLLEARAQKAALLFVKQQLSGNLAYNLKFRAKTGIGWLDRLLTAARLKELSRVKIVKAGKSSGLRYNISELSSSWYGQKILEGLSFSRRRTSVTRDEFERIQQACAAIKLTLPEVVEPTTTERFFAETP